MRRYETIVIADSELSENERTSLFTRIKEIIPQQQGVLIKEDLWGTKKLAYEIKKKPRGYYARYDFCGMGSLVDELERFFRIDDRVLKYLTVLLDPDADVEKIQAEAAAIETGSDAGKAPQETSETSAPAQEPASAAAENSAATESTEPAAEAGVKE